MVIYHCAANFFCRGMFMEVFYLKINQPPDVTWLYLKTWLDIAQQFPVAKTYIVCDKPDLQAFITNQIKFGGGV